MRQFKDRVAVIHGVRVFTPITLRQGEEGHIVNTASAAGFVSMASTAPYAVSKHAVVTLSEVLYRDLQDEKAKIGVSVLCPAWVNTNIWNAQRNRPAGRFYIFPHPKIRKDIQTRMEDILELRNPTRTA